MFLRELINNKWSVILEEEFDKEYFKDLEQKLSFEYLNYIIYPEKENIFKALELTDYDDVSVVIIGQDPYHNPNEAHGLAFSTKLTKFPASLKNIYKELKDDLNVNRDNGNLTDWAKQGVLLLNTVLTVRKNQPNSHKKIGWLTFTNCIIEKLNERNRPIIFVLWGDNAISKEKLITNPNHYIIKSPHPSPLAAYRGFFGSKPFSQINDILSENNQKKIIW